MTTAESIVDLYVKLTKGIDIATIGAPYSYYYADQTTTGSDIIIHDVFNVDIRSAFPTICKILFGKDDPFVKKIFEKTDKKERNIFISTTLKENERQGGINYLNEITLMSKLLVFNYVFTYYNNITILEYVKDGMYIAGSKNEDFNENQLEFINIMKDYDIQFHDDPIDLYIRFNKTSIYRKNNETIIKGKYKGPPKCVEDIIDKLFEGHYYNNALLNLIQKDYSQLLFKIVYNSGIKEYLDYLYLFENGKYLNDKNEFTQNMSETNPTAYLFNIIYPVLNLLRIYNSQK